MATINIKVANENKQNSVIQGQEEIKTKLKTPKIKSSQSGYVKRTKGTLTQQQKAYGYEFLISRINPVNASKCELVYNANGGKGSDYQGDGSFPLIYGDEYGSTGDVSFVEEAFHLQLKSDGVYATPVTKSITTPYYFLAGISWQVIEFY